MKTSAQKLQALMDAANANLEQIVGVPAHIDGLALRCQGQIIEARIFFDDQEPMHAYTATILANPITLAESVARTFVLSRWPINAAMAFPDEDTTNFAIPYRQANEVNGTVEAVGSLAMIADTPEPGNKLN